MILNSVVIDLKRKVFTRQAYERLGLEAMLQMLAELERLDIEAHRSAQIIAELRISKAKGRYKMRVTKDQLYRKVCWMQELGIDIIIEWAYGQPCCYTRGGRCLGPRLSTGQMLMWLEAYQDGFGAGYDKAEADLDEANLEALEA